ncbi:probable E3 ubiquitin-protein ligase XBOS32 isoform X3 [Malus domestica]|uniref:probable E3 ubiquitin-protein ligase XBOS32 isoform X3 n=1 Tax=Malus domestica TaxID=3750 RepID=UPI0010AA1008|nr:probable E3 ubiquitin-protein ligase XBOS32 isoform X3 [Malus domestica]
MKFLGVMGNSFGCSASGERLVSAARDGDVQEAKALLECNPRLARYSTFGVRNSPLHYSAAQGHHEIVSVLLESGVDINLRNYRGQTALMQACQHGHWEVVQTLMLSKATIHRADYLNGGTALHFAALNGHSRCIRLLLADYITSTPDFWTTLRNADSNEESITEFNHDVLFQIINRPADGGITALHMAALNGHIESVQLLLGLGASVSKVTAQDGATVDLIVQYDFAGLVIRMYFLNHFDNFAGAGSTALHYAACGGNAECCQILISRGSSLSAENANGWTPVMVARSWHRDWLEEVLTTEEGQSQILPSPYLSLPLMSIMKIARECGWRNNDCLSTFQDPCVVCLEQQCTVAAEGCDHEFCTRCALYLCSTNCTSTASNGPPGSIACPLCRNGIVSFVKLRVARSMAKENARTSLSLSFCTCSSEGSDSSSITTPLYKPEFRCSRKSPLGSFRSLSCQKFPSIKINYNLCMGAPNINPCLVPSSSNRKLRNHLARSSKTGFRRSASQPDGRRSWYSSFNQNVTIGSGC